MISNEKIITIFYNALKEGGKLIFSTPYNQLKCPASMKFHKCFNIVEETIINLLAGKFEIETFYYQDYETHDFKTGGDKKDFIICVAKKI